MERDKGRGVSITDQANNEFFAEFLEDYFAECGEHLTIARRKVLELERFIDQPTVDRSLLDELLRSCHSIKGISGMVGLREAEQLAHQLESYLRALRNGQRLVRAEGMDALIAGIKLLEQVIAEYRAQITLTDIGPVMSQLDLAVSESQPRSVSSEGSQNTGADEGSILPARDNGKRTWRFQFIPLPELAGRGINVNVIRARLQEIGDLVHAAPRVTPQGGIVFDFVVTSCAEEATFADWSNDGLTYSRYQASATDDYFADEPEKSLVQTSSVRAPSNMVRVDLSRLDNLMRMVGELVISRSRLDDQVKHLEPTLRAPDWRPLQETNLAMERQLRDLREGVMRVRMVPIGEIFERMQFVVRDLAREYQKSVRLELSGQQTEIDKFLVERMMDPILHLVRNAVSHGLETSAERVTLGKPAEGKINLRAFAAAERVVIEIEDDGRGIDKDQVASRARATGLITNDLELESRTLLDLISAPGFSTRVDADRASGRGVGMNVVNNAVLGLGGTIELKTGPGRGTLFTIQLPLTLAIADALIVRAGHQLFAVPQASVREVIEVERADLKAIENNDIILYRGGVLPLLRLAALFGLEEEASSYFHAFVVGSGLNAAGIAVDRILGQREIVVRQITDPLIQVTGVAGATELGDGKVVLILDAVSLSRYARRPTCDKLNYSQLETQRES